MTLVNTRLEPFELDPDFERTLSGVVSEILASIREGRERHGDAFATVGLPGFAMHCFRKAKDLHRIVMDGVDVGDSLQGVNKDLATYAVLCMAYIQMAERRQET